MGSAGVGSGRNSDAGGCRQLYPRRALPGCRRTDDSLSGARRASLPAVPVRLRTPAARRMLAPMPGPTLRASVLLPLVARTDSSDGSDGQSRAELSIESRWQENGR